jgi:hypothetical protein
MHAMITEPYRSPTALPQTGIAEPTAYPVVETVAAIADVMVVMGTLAVSLMRLHVLKDLHRAAADIPEYFGAGMTLVLQSAVIMAIPCILCLLSSLIVAIAALRHLRITRQQVLVLCVSAANALLILNIGMRWVPILVPADWLLS